MTQQLEEKIKEIVTRMASEYPAYAYKQLLALYKQALEEERARIIEKVEELPTGMFDSTPYLKVLLDELTTIKK